MRSNEFLTLPVPELPRARCLLEREDNGAVHATNYELATMIGTSREVVSRRIEVLARRGIVKAQRGVIDLVDARALDCFMF